MLIHTDWHEPSSKHCHLQPREDALGLWQLYATKGRKMARAGETSPQVGAWTTYCRERLGNGAVPSPRPGTCQGDEYKWLCRRALLVIPFHATQPPLYQSTDSGVSETAGRLPSRGRQFPWVHWKAANWTQRVTGSYHQHGWGLFLFFVK